MDPTRWSAYPTCDNHAAEETQMARPIEIRMGGYGPASTSFSRSLKLIGDRLTAELGDAIDVKYAFNIMDLGYKGEEILWLVESGLLSLGYQSSSYLTDRVPELGIADLPFIFKSNEEARAAMDGAFGEALAKAIEARCDYRILGWFENGFRHISNKRNAVRAPADLRGMTIRVLPSKIQARTFELLGAAPQIMDLSEAIARVKAGTIDAQENPFANTVTYGVHNFHKFHTTTRHFYLSRPIFLNRAQFDGWPVKLQEAMRAAVREAVAWQRGEAIQEDAQSRAAILAAGCEIIEPTATELAAFARAVRPMMEEARTTYAPELVSQLPGA
jgi:tripartite ATP-independent transporter DctP family solute receptor